MPSASRHHRMASEHKGFAKAVTKPRIQFLLHFFPNSWYLKVRTSEKGLHQLAFKNDTHISLAFTSETDWVFICKGSAQMFTLEFSCVNPWVQNNVFPILMSSLFIHFLVLLLICSGYICDTLRTDSLSLWGGDLRVQNFELRTDELAKADLFGFGKTTKQHVRPIFKEFQIQHVGWQE